MNEVAKVNTSTAVAVPQKSFFAQYAEQISQRTIVGKLLKFSKGDYFAGQDEEQVDVGTKLVANMDQLLVGWIRWEDNKPAEQIMGRLSEGYQPPTRKELGFHDKDEWEIDEQSGQPRDPWQFANYLLMKDPDLEGEESLYTFTTQSKGGLGAIGLLCDTYDKRMRMRPNDYPIVELGVGSYKHSNKSFGWIKFPKLTIVGWSKKVDFEAAMEAEAAAAEAQEAADRELEEFGEKLGGGKQEEFPETKAGIDYAKAGVVKEDDAIDAILGAEAKAASAPAQKGNRAKATARF